MEELIAALTAAAAAADAADPSRATRVTIVPTGVSVTTIAAGGAITPPTSSERVLTWAEIEEAQADPERDLTQLVVGKVELNIATIGDLI